MLTLPKLPSFENGTYLDRALFIAARETLAMALHEDAYKRHGNPVVWKERGEEAKDLYRAEAQTLMLEGIV